jgi:chitinase
MGRTKRSRALALEVASILALLALARCHDLPVAPTESNGNGGLRTEGATSVACFTTEPDPPEVAAREPIVLDAGCSVGIDEGAVFEWDLGDGRSATGQRVEARYRESGEFTVTLRVRDRGAMSETNSRVRIRPRPNACFVFHQVLENDPDPCTVAFDASCSSGSIAEYRWFFEGGPRPDLPLPDTNVATHDPEIIYSWGRDEECFTFRPFDRIVRLTVVDDRGATDVQEETVVFRTPILRR